MAGLDFIDGLKVALVAVFLLGSVQLHSAMDESGTMAPRAEKNIDGNVEPAGSRSVRMQGVPAYPGEGGGPSW